MLELEDRVGERVAVLLVDDQAELRRMLGRALEREGFFVVEAGSGEEALEILPGYAGRFRMLVTDVMMPGINGCELAERVVEREPQIRVLFISGCAGSLVPPSAPFLQKPFGPKVLLRAVAQMLDARQPIAEGTGA